VLYRKQETFAKGGLYHRPVLISTENNRMLCFLEVTPFVSDETADAVELKFCGLNAMNNPNGD